jgi:hypothetical protein
MLAIRIRRAISLLVWGFLPGLWEEAGLRIDDNG